MEPFLRSTTKLTLLVMMMRWRNNTSNSNHAAHTATQSVSQSGGRIDNVFLDLTDDCEDVPYETAFSARTD